MAVDWLTTRISLAAGREHTISDAIRIIVGEAVRKEVERADMAGEPVPDAVRQLVG